MVLTYPVSFSVAWITDIGNIVNTSTICPLQHMIMKHR